MIQFVRRGSLESTSHLALLLREIGCADGFGGSGAVLGVSQAVDGYPSTVTVAGARVGRVVSMKGGASERLSSV